MKLKHLLVLFNVLSYVGSMLSVGIPGFAGAALRLMFGFMYGLTLYELVMLKDDER